MAERGDTTTRRALLGRLARAAGVAAPVLAWFEGESAALPAGEVTDLAVLSASIALEHHAIALYDAGLRRGLFPAGLRGYAVEFRGDHLGHRDTQIALAEERGGRAPQPLVDYGIDAVLRDGQDLLVQALEVEQAAQRAYLKILSQIRTRDYRLTAAFVLIDEVRHMTVWQRVLGRRLY